MATITLICIIWIAINMFSILLSRLCPHWVFAIMAPSGFLCFYLCFASDYPVFMLLAAFVTYGGIIWSLSAGGDGWAPRDDTRDTPRQQPLPPRTIQPQEPRDIMLD